MDWSDESLSLLPAAVADENVAELGLNILRGDLLLPALVLKRQRPEPQHFPNGEVLPGARSLASLPTPR